MVLLDVGRHSWPDQSGTVASSSHQVSMAGQLVSFQCYHAQKTHHVGKSPTVVVVDDDGKDEKEKDVSWKNRLTRHMAPSFMPCSRSSQNVQFRCKQEFVDTWMLRINQASPLSSVPIVDQYCSWTTGIPKETKLYACRATEKLT